MVIEKDQVVTLKEAQAIQAAINEKYGLEDRVQFELDNMSPGIKPQGWAGTDLEYYLQFTTKTFVGITEDTADGAYLVDVHPEEIAITPKGATRVTLVEQPDGSRVKAVKPAVVQKK